MSSARRMAGTAGRRLGGLSVAGNPRGPIHGNAVGGHLPAIALTIFTNTFNRINDTTGDFLSVKEE
jgi:hypothetical protein